MFGRMERVGSEYLVIVDEFRYSLMLTEPLIYTDTRSTWTF